MTARFTVLASGSSGNAAFLSHRGFGLLIDCGIGPRAIADRLTAAGAKWADVSAVVLTHTHGDHWKGLTLLRMQRERVPLVLHADHARTLADIAAEFPGLAQAGLIRTFRDGEPFAFADGFHALPIRVPHDSEPTFAFRFNGWDPETNAGWSLGYASDLGHANAELARAFRSVDVLALEFNHDVELQRRSHRPADLVARVLGPRGHLSNEQAAGFVRERIAHRARPLQAIFQLHLSRECNEPARARAAAAAVFPDGAPKPPVVTARQDGPTNPWELEFRTIERSEREPVARLGVSVQRTLPGFG